MAYLKHIASLFLTSVVLWLLLSGHYNALLLSLGIVSAALTTYLAIRMEVVDHESHPVGISLSLLTYWLWLGKEIVKSNLTVAAHILRRNIDISPRVARIPSGHRSDIGRAIFANSITLTPGTVSLSVEEDSIEVHALLHGGIEDLQKGVMAGRVPDPGERP